MKVQWKWKKRAWSLRGRTTFQPWKCSVSSSLMSMEFKQWRYLAGKKDRSASSLSLLVVSSTMIGRGIKSTPLLISTTNTRSTKSNKWFVPHAIDGSITLTHVQYFSATYLFCFGGRCTFYWILNIPGLPHCSCFAATTPETLLLLHGLGRRPLQVKDKASLSHWQLREEVECWKERLLLNSVHVRTRMDHLSGLISKRFKCTVPWLLHHLRSSSSYHIIGWRCGGCGESEKNDWGVDDFRLEQNDCWRQWFHAIKIQNDLQALS